MRKGMILFVLFSCLLFPKYVWAGEEKYTSLGLEEACIEENIEFNHPEYEESSEKANIYLFRGRGCEHCYEFLTYLEAMTDQYGDYFNLISFEVWYDSQNDNLKKKVAKRLGDEVKGVPYIVIGKKSWAGYSDTLNEEIYQAIQEEYENKNQNDIVSKVIESEGKIGISDFLIPGVAILFIGGFFFARSKTKQEVSLEEKTKKG